MKRDKPLGQLSEGFVVMLGSPAVSLPLLRVGMSRWCTKIETGDRSPTEAHLRAYCRHTGNDAQLPDQPTTADVDKPALAG
ncbi:hypothetical protein IFM12276_02210 [Nocardia sputorum]|uniref:XRE family transcriptional regulator n=1 Tax=Nocardia sputorum TaxID=2984338 RepID=A0ABN6TVE7_9NOCA|nr:hypothetical protein IFM12276_02210 [Nocardia sputorum]